MEMLCFIMQHAEGFCFFFIWKPFKPKGATEQLISLWLANVTNVNMYNVYELLLYLQSVKLNYKYFHCYCMLELL